MKNTLLFILTSIILISCNPARKYAKDTPVGSKKIKEGLYRETYCTHGGGVYASNVYSCYLTDSISFRKYLGTEDDYELIYISPLNDSIIFVRKFEIDTDMDIETMEYNLHILKREGKFD